MPRNNTLTALHGIGPWTADVYLLFCLGHGDAWPAGDIAIQEPSRSGLACRRRPTVKRWRRWPSLGARYAARRRICGGGITAC